MIKNKKLALSIKIFASVILAAGIVLVSFAPISNFIGNLIATGETEDFDEEVENIVNDGTYEEALENKEIDEEGYPIDENGNRTSDTPLRYKADIDRLKADSLAYNENLRENQGSLLTNSYAYSQPSLDLRDYGIYDGIYGYVTAESIGMNLPIYLGANNANMSYGAAHLTYTSLPVGGKKSNVVLAGHTGYIGRIFFDNIRNLQIGDTVKVTNYWETLSYKVVKTEIHIPDDSALIFINDDRDLLTMLTCISDGSGGFNRYYVICERS